MKRFILPGLLGAFSCLIVAVLSCGREPDAAIDAKLRELDAGFAKADSPEDFEVLASLCRDVRERGFVNGDLLFSQGNALMEADKPGAAIAAYQQARRYRIRDARLKSNLETALGGRLSEEKRSVIDFFFFWQNWLSYPEKFRAAALACGITLLIGLVLLRLKRATALRRTAFVCLFISLLLCASAVLDWYRYDWTRHGVVVEESADAWKGNSTKSSKAFKEPLGEGTGFIVLEEWGDWVRIRLNLEQISRTGGGGNRGDATTECWIKRNDAVYY